MTNIARRLAQLEKAVCPAAPSPTWVQIIVRPEEDKDDVIARWRAEHPEAPEDVSFIIHKIVRPQRREAVS